MADDDLSTEQLGWLLGQSSGSIRDRIRDGEIEATRIPQGFRISRAEARRLSRERIESEAGRSVSDRELEALIDKVLSENQRITGS